MGNTIISWGCFVVPCLSLGKMSINYRGGNGVIGLFSTGRACHELGFGRLVLFPLKLALSIWGAWQFDQKRSSHIWKKWIQPPWLWVKKNYIMCSQDELDFNQQKMVSNPLNVIVLTNSLLMDCSFCLGWIKTIWFLGFTCPQLDFTLGRAKLQKSTESWIDDVPMTEKWLSQRAWFDDQSATKCNFMFFDVSHICISYHIISYHIYIYYHIISYYLTWYYISETKRGCEATNTKAPFLQHVSH